MNHLRTAVIVALIFVIAVPQFALGQRFERPDVLVQRISNEVLDAARSDDEIQRGNRSRILDLVREKILPHVDFERMTALTAGKYWRMATEKQRQRLTEEFRDLLMYVYSGALAQAGNNKVVVQPLRDDLSDGEAVVHTEVIQPRGREAIELNYRLARGPGGWKIFDVSILGAWLVQSYRGTFASEIRASGIDGLIDALDEKNAQLAGTMAGESTVRLPAIAEQRWWSTPVAWLSEKDMSISSRLIERASWDDRPVLPAFRAVPAAATES